MTYTKISDHFTMEEMTKTETGLYNVPREFAKLNLKLLIQKILEPLRVAMKFPIVIDSGYRSDAVNQAAKGAKNSQHLIGRAVDFRCKDMAAAFLYIKDNLEFDQLIWEYGDKNQPGWIHVSYSAMENRNEVLRSFKLAGITYYRQIR